MFLTNSEMDELFRGYMREYEEANSFEQLPLWEEPTPPPPEPSVCDEFLVKLRSQCTFCKKIYVELGISFSDDDSAPQGMATLVVHFLDVGDDSSVVSEQLLKVWHDGSYEWDYGAEQVPLSKAWLYAVRRIMELLDGEGEYFELAPDLLPAMRYCQYYGATHYAMDNPCLEQTMLNIKREPLCAEDEECIDAARYCVEQAKDAATRIRRQKYLTACEIILRARHVGLDAYNRAWQFWIDKLEDDDVHELDYLMQLQVHVFGGKDATLYDLRCLIADCVRQDPSDDWFLDFARQTMEDEGVPTHLIDDAFADYHREKQEGV